ncbi:MAG: winged helix DNA-binding domain-containing protein [Chloroflexota bacterium]
MATLHWNEVFAWRLSQQSLDKRARHGHMLDVVSRMGGAHAQLMSAAELSLWARVRDLTALDVQQALWHDRTLVKTWAMRGTLHLVTATDFLLYIALFRTFIHYRRGSWLKYHGVTLDELEAIIEGVRSILGDVGLTREQLAEALAEQTDTLKLLELLRSGWGALLKPSAFLGDLCFGPNQGQQVTFVRPAAWLTMTPPSDEQHARETVIRRYLTTYGPATIDELARWFGMEASAAKKHLRALGNAVVEIDVEGWTAWLLADTLEQMVERTVSGVVRLLPHFDPYTIAVARHHQYLMLAEHKTRVYRAQGWISPVVLVDGEIVGVWKHEKQQNHVVVQIELFAPQTEQVKQGIEEEAKRLGVFLETEVELVYI